MGNRNGTSSRGGRRSRGRRASDLLGASAVIASAVIPRKTNPGMAVSRGAQAGAGARSAGAVAGDRAVQRELDRQERVAPQVMSVLQKKLAVQRSTPPSGARSRSRARRRSRAALPAADGSARSVRPAARTPSTTAAWPDARAARARHGRARGHASARRGAAARTTTDVAVHRAADGSEAGRVRAHQASRATQR